MSNDSVGSVRWMVWSRDQGCVARMVDRDAGPCFDRWGKIIDDWHRLPFDVGEMDYVRLEATAPQHQSPSDHVWLCAGHHRGTGPNHGFQWATSHRRAERDYLDAL